MPNYTRRFSDQNGIPTPEGLLERGPVLNVQIGVPESLANYLEQSGSIIPSPSSGICLIDTGATHTAVDLQVANQLGIQPHDHAEIGTGAGQTTKPVFQIHLDLPQEGIQLETPRAIGVDLTGQTVGGNSLITLLGRDVLKNCLLIYNGLDASFTLSI